jgi:hypothetical protein
MGDDNAYLIVGNGFVEPFIDRFQIDSSQISRGICNFRYVVHLPRRPRGAAFENE